MKTKHILTGLLLSALLLHCGCIDAPPRVKYLAYGSGWINTTSAIYKYTARDAADDVLNCSLIRTNVTNGTIIYDRLVARDEIITENVSLSEGLNYISLSCIDDAGNVGIASTLEIGVDTMIPEVEWLDFPE